MDERTAGNRSVALAEKVQFLRQTSAYSHHPVAVDATESHMSWIFLAGEFVFKLKKPVRYDFLDFTSLHDREFYCREELRLNKRLAPGVYLDVAALCLEPGGSLNLKGNGKVIDWLVRMRRLPSDRMLDHLIARESVDRAQVDVVARQIIAFYRSAEPVEQSLQQVCKRFEVENARNTKLLADLKFDLDHSLTEDVMQGMASALSEVRPLLARRIAQKAFLEAHGDLRPEHICLTSPPVIIDCLEFSRDLRLLDPFDEMAFLALECDRLGAPWVGQRILAACKRELVPAAPAELIAFYTASRALLRARLALAHLTEPNPRTPEKWEPRARDYIRLAATALHQFKHGSAPI